MKYLITKKFIKGILKGMKIKEYTTTSFEIGKEYKDCAGNSDYIVEDSIACGDKSILEIVNQ